MSGVVYIEEFPEPFVRKIVNGVAKNQEIEIAQDGEELLLSRICFSVLKLK